jgi:beta-galactosidase/beta-glucuronidase
MKFAALLAAAAFAATAADWKPAANTLTTPWTAKVGPGKALPEYPRPQMARKAWTNLNGLWDYAILSQDAARPDSFEGKILVPFPLESALSGVKRALDPGQRLWYRRTFRAPDLKGGRLLLHFGAVDWRAEVFLNGTRVGDHEGGYDAFEFDITAALKPGGAQEVAVGVWDPTDTALHPRGKQVLKPNSIWYTAVSGIWQTVWIEPVPAVSITGLRIAPDVDGRRALLSVSSTSAGAFTAVVKLRGRVVGRLTGKTGEAPAAIPLSAVELWSPDTPVLYDLELALPSGDRLTSYFGMRKIEVRKDSAGLNRLFLNNQPRFMIGPLDQGWWPDGLYTAPGDAAIRFDIETLKKLGFNMMRKHVKVEPARYYYWCDRLGMMVWQDMPSATTGRTTNVGKGAGADAAFSGADAAAFARELKALLDGLRNAPSVIAWVPFNEGWGQHAANDVLKMVKSYDPSRLVDGPSGWEDRGWGDMKDMHEYPGPNMFPPIPDRASVLGEFGGLGYPIAGHLWAADKRNWGYRGFQDKASLQAAYKDLIDKLGPLVKQGLAAAIYTQTSDVETEANGLMTYDRKVVKFDAAKLAALHRALMASVSASQAVIR